MASKASAVHLAASVRDDRPPPRAALEQTSSHALVISSRLPSAPNRERSTSEIDTSPAGAAAFSTRTAADTHARLIELTGVGRWFGSASAYAAAEPDARAEWRRVRVRAGTAARPPARMSALSWVLRHVGVIYREANRGDRFRGILAIVEGHEARPEALVRELVEDGWRERAVPSHLLQRGEFKGPRFYVGLPMSGLRIAVGSGTRTWTIDDTREPDDPRLIDQRTLDRRDGLVIFTPPEHLQVRDD